MRWNWRPAVEALLELSAVKAIKTIAKTTFLGAFVFGFLGGVVGAVAAVFIWPSSNLGPPVGAIEGALFGVTIGIFSGFVFGLVRVIAPKRKAGSGALKSEKTEL